MRWTITTTLLLPCLLMIRTGSVAAAPSHNDTVLVARVLELTNGERQKAGLRPLTLSPELNDAAQNYSQVLATSGCFEHTCGPVTNFADRDRQAGYTGWLALAENIAEGYATPETVVTGWMNSAGHRANILSPEYTEMGIGLVNGTGTFDTYWTQEFGSRPGVVVDPAPPADAVAGDNVAASDTGDDDSSGG
jgi:uncharacterized protein YkwD